MVMVAIHPDWRTAPNKVKVLQCPPGAPSLAAERAQREKSGIERLVIPTDLGDIVIPVSEIDWIGADDYYALLHVGQKSYLLRESLNSLEKKLDPLRFARIHRSAIIQLDRVKTVRTNTQGDEAVLRDGSLIPVSRRKRGLLLELLRQA